MKSFFCVLLAISLLAISVPASATNGDNLMAIGPIARSMGGVGIAAPQDAISAVFSNPAAMCFGPYCPGSEVDFGGTLFIPKVKARILTSGILTESDSDEKVYAIPAIGLSVPINPSLRFGLSAYGVSGLGVDYRGTAVERGSIATPGGNFPLVAGEYTQLQIMKFSPCLAYTVNERLSVGLGIHIDYANLDLRHGSSFDYALGAQAGAIFKATDSITLGAVYVTPQSVTYKKVTDFDQDGSLDNLKLQQPQLFGVGMAFEPVKGKLLIEADGQWINWSGATGYDAFDWEDQWVFAIGAQYKPVKGLALRMGYNVANNPVKKHDNFGGMTPTGPLMTSVQGKIMPEYYYETFRIIGFPAIVKQHAAFGIGYEFSNRLAVNAGYTHAFRERIAENGTNIAGQPVTLESELSEDSFEFGITWRF